MQTDAVTMLNDMIAKYTTDLETVREMRRREASCTVVSGHPFCVVLGDGTMSADHDAADRSLRFKVLRADLCGSQWWSPESARRVAAAAAKHPGAATGGVRVVTRGELLAMREASIAEMLLHLETAAIGRTPIG